MCSDVLPNISKSDPGHLHLPNQGLLPLRPPCLCLSAHIAQPPSQILPGFRVATIRRSWGPSPTAWPNCHRTQQSGVPTGERGLYGEQGQWKCVITKIQHRRAHPEHRTVVVSGPHRLDCFRGRLTDFTATGKKSNSNWNANSYSV